MSGGKHRASKIKQEHTIIEDILPLLEEISKFSTVKSIIPGRINRRGGSGVSPHLQLKYNTPSGLKMLGKNSSSLQEIFLVTDNAEKTIQLIQKKKFVR